MPSHYLNQWWLRLRTCACFIGPHLKILGYKTMCHPPTAGGTSETWLIAQTHIKCQAGITYHPVYELFIGGIINQIAQQNFLAVICVTSINGMYQITTKICHPPTNPTNKAIKLSGNNDKSLSFAWVCQTVLGWRVKQIYMQGCR